MRKYIVLFSALFYIGISIYELYYAYAPKVGPIGNGPNDKLIWTDFIFSMIGGSAFLTIAIMMFMRDKKKSVEKEEEK
ncbi:hypothetical protein [Ammoniphilus sp. CFH 90114]|uniref:hypothetical protein n=1 Tax=Ammoniphilus sp. CFH 90114 TaxID=2493665 RepID=UPI00100DAE1A|nr:hypothetical protein [Ammoniphilus sp. CFH 90114]RXT03736.1 hypothetical protein EIZ39_23130 [Ammoniphilus sp. CFH 90114]